MVQYYWLFSNIYRLFQGLKRLVWCFCKVHLYIILSSLKYKTIYKYSACQCGIHVKYICQSFSTLRSMFTSTSDNAFPPSDPILFDNRFNSSRVVFVVKASCPTVCFFFFF
ncbi:hypothetical protein C2G38_2056628 [Gigaspora rosea]|uniref:Uncharacterized protein n=1 Tax=Gigaspora rosea TaxID=44941 RepID=A0A397W5F9_9GLOM|nr:hypothetical protein C2G38_2056628 [Gigaspora rosea]